MGNYTVLCRTSHCVDRASIQEHNNKSCTVLVFLNPGSVHTVKSNTSFKTPLDHVIVTLCECFEHNKTNHGIVDNPIAAFELEIKELSGQHSIYTVYRFVYKWHTLYSGCSPCNGSRKFKRVTQTCLDKKITTVSLLFVLIRPC